MRAFLLFILLIITAISAGSYWIYEHRLTTPMPLIDKLPYKVPAKTNLSQVAIDLMNKGLMDYPTALTWVMLARLQKKAHLIKAGEYTIPSGTTPQELLQILIDGKAVRHSLTLPEGWTFRQVLNAIQQDEDIVHTLEGLDDKAIMAKLGWPDQHPEGRFYPDTYHFGKNTTDVTLLQMAYRRMAEELETIWSKRKPDLPLKDSYDALILASIVEKETGVAAERPMIAGVFIRRLKKGMLLQTDPTVIYALGDAYTGNIRKDDLKVDSPYNTYLSKNKGLPPTPIAMPGGDALRAVVNPAEGESLFFVAKGDGSHYFSASLTEHECAIIAYQLKDKTSNTFKNRCNQNPRCDACRG